MVLTVAASRAAREERRRPSRVSPPPRPEAVAPAHSSPGPTGSASGQRRRPFRLAAAVDGSRRSLLSLGGVPPLRSAAALLLVAVVLGAVVLGAAGCGGSSGQGQDDRQSEQ